MAQGNQAKLVAETLEISRSSLYRIIQESGDSSPNAILAP